jgi:hypothetical protein
MRRLPAGTGVVAFAGTAKLIASNNPGAAIRGVLVHLIRQFSQRGISSGNRIVLKIGIRGDVRNRSRERLHRSNSQRVISALGHSRPGLAGRRSSHVRYAPKAMVGHQNAIGRGGP